MAQMGGQLWQSELQYFCYMLQIYILYEWCEVVRAAMLQNLATLLAWQHSLGQIQPRTHVLEKAEKSAWYPLFAHAHKDSSHFPYNLSRYVRGSYNGKICGKCTTSACSKMAFKYCCCFCLSLEDAKHATNLFTVEAKHANLLGCLGLIFFVDGKRWVSIASMQKL